MRVATSISMGVATLILYQRYLLMHDPIAASPVYLYWVYMGMERLEYLRFISRDIWTDS